MPQEEEGYSSVFDVASKLPKKKSLEKAGTAPKEEGQVVSHEEGSFPVEDLGVQFARYKKMHNEIKSKVENTFEKANMSPSQVKEYLSSPSQFSSKAWSEVQSTKKEFDQKLEQLVPQKADKEKEKKEESEDKAKPKKGGLVSKKRWLPMR